MLDIDILKAHGASAEDWQKLLEVAYNDPKQTGPLMAFRNRIRSRIQAGQTWNLENARIWHAIDLAMDCSFQQVSPTLLASLEDKTYPTKESANDALKQWGIMTQEVIQEVADPKTPGKNIYRVSSPAFFKIVPPLVLAYLTMRSAKIMNDRKATPYYKYAPVLDEPEARIRCETITDRIQTMSTQMGYYESDRDAVFKMLLYSEAFKFPVEEWYSEQQLVPKDHPGDGETVEIDGKTYKRITVKEGIRHHIPHPSRTFYDRAHPPATFNTGNGCNYAGYWRVLTFKEVRETKGFYNLDQVGITDNKTWQEGGLGYMYLTQISPCAITFPSIADTAGVGDLDTEKFIASHQTYTNTMDDKAILLTEYFEKLVPADCGLGTYPHPVWARIVVASNDTIVYAAPLTYDPVIYYGDSASGRTLNASMAMQAIPYQDQYGNLLSQFLLAVRQNLANMTFVDKDSVMEEDIKKVEGFGERWWRSLNIVRFSGKKLRQMGSNVSEAVIGSRFPTMDTVGIQNGMRMVLDVLERVLVMSSQEVGQAASHEQTREEVRQVSSNTSTRLTWSANAVDLGREAQKRQIYAGLMAYGDPEFWVNVTMEEPVTIDKLEEMGFTTKDGAAPHPTTRKINVKANKEAIAYERFASDRDGEDRVNDAQTAGLMIQLLQGFPQNQMLLQALGPDQLVKVVNYIGRLAGFPRDFKLTNVSQQQQPDPAAMMQQVKQYIDGVAKQLSGDTQKALTHVMDEMKQDAQALQEQGGQIQQQGAVLKSVMESVKHIQTVVAQAPPVAHPSQYDSPAVTGPAGGQPPLVAGPVPGY